MIRPLQITQTLDGRVLIARGARIIELHLDELPPAIELLRLALQFRQIDVAAPLRAAGDPKEVEDVATTYTR